MKPPMRTLSPVSARARVEILRRVSPLGVGVGVAEGLMVGVTLGVGVIDGLGVVLGVGVMLGLGVVLGLGVIEGVGVGLPLGLGVGVMVGVIVTVGVGEGDCARAALGKPAISAVAIPSAKVSRHVCIRRKMIASASR
jgi:hypothetical protein